MRGYVQRNDMKSDDRDKAEAFFRGVDTLAVTFQWKDVDWTNIGAERVDHNPKKTASKCK